MGCASSLSLPSELPDLRSKEDVRGVGKCEALEEKKGLAFNVPSLRGDVELPEVSFTVEMLADGVRDNQLSVSLLTLKVSPLSFLKAFYERDSKAAKLMGQDELFVPRIPFNDRNRLFFPPQYLSVLVFGGLNETHVLRASSGSASCDPSMGTVGKREEKEEDDLQDCL